MNSQPRTQALIPVAGNRDKNLGTKLTNCPLYACLRLNRRQYLAFIQASAHMYKLGSISEGMNLLYSVMYNRHTLTFIFNLL